MDIKNQNKLIVRHYFDASHQLPDTPQLVTKACARLHGHTYAVIVEAEAPNLNQAGMVIDFKAIKTEIDVLDHQHINSIFIEKGFNRAPTAENIAEFIYQQLVKQLNILVTRVAVDEGYKGEERASWAIYEP